MKPKSKQVKKKPAEPAGKPGPKPKLVHSELLLDQIRQLGQIQCTVEEVAAVIRHDHGVGVSLRTMQNFFADHPDAKDMHEAGKLAGRTSLRRAQFATAIKGNATMQIWLGKQLLEQREPVQKIETGKPGDFDLLDDAQLQDEITQQTRELMELDPEFAKELLGRGAKAATKH